MDKKYTVEMEDDITIITFLQKPTLEEFKEAIDYLQECNSYALRLWDLSEIDFDLPSEKIRELSFYGKSKFTRPNKSAFVTATDLAFGEMRMLRAYKGEDEADTNVFRSRPAAMEWLKVFSTSAE